MVTLLNLINGLIQTFGITNDEISSNVTYHVDMWRVVHDHTVHRSLCDFKDTTSIEDKKAHKSILFFKFLYELYNHMAPDYNPLERVPLNTVVFGLIPAYARLEQNVVIKSPYHLHFDNQGYCKNILLLLFMLDMIWKLH